MILNTFYSPKPSLGLTRLVQKFILFLVLISTLSSDEKVYIGTGYGYHDENFNKDISAHSASNMGKLKFGYGDIKAYAIELSLDYIDNRSKIFSPNDNAKYGLNLDFVKAFDFNIPVNPFFKVGFGAGYFNVERELENSLSYGSFNLGGGLFIPLTGIIDLEIGYEHKYTTYQAVETIASKISYESSVNISYLGFNVRF